ncbi:hypothetical protein [Streptomyces sp. NPDC003395]
MLTFVVERAGGHGGDWLDGGGIQPGPQRVRRSGPVLDAHLAASNGAYVVATFGQPTESTDQPTGRADQPTGCADQPTGCAEYPFTDFSAGR